MKIAISIWVLRADHDHPFSLPAPSLSLSLSQFYELFAKLAE